MLIENVHHFASSYIYIYIYIYPYKKQAAGSYELFLSNIMFDHSTKISIVWYENMDGITTEFENSIVGIVQVQLLIEK